MPKPFSPEIKLNPQEELERRGIENVDFALKVDSEKDGGGEEIKADIFWVRYKVPQGEQYQDLDPVEGKLYFPRDNTNGELVHFSAGYPGGNAGRFEQIYAKAITDAGYVFSTHRFNGTSVNAPDASEIFNCSQRIDYAQKHDEQHIGGEKIYRAQDVVKLPIIPIISLQKNFNNINFIGHSMGQATNIISISRLAEMDPDLGKKIGNMVSIAGYVGVSKLSEGQDESIKMSPEELAIYEIERIKEKQVNTTNDKDEYLAQLDAVSVMNKNARLPQQVRQILVFSPDDPLIGGPKMETPGVLKDYGPKTKSKAIIRDQTGAGKPKPHSMLWISPQNMVRALRARVPQGVYGITLPVKKGDKLFIKEE